MAQVIVRNLPDDVVARLKARAWPDHAVVLGRGPD